MRRRRRPPSIVAAITVVLLAGCGTTGTPAANPATGGGARPSPVPNNVNKRKQVALTTCGAVSDGWGTSGTVVNPAKGPTTFHITVAFITSGGVEESSGHTAVAVPANRIATWTVSERFTARPGTRCVLRGVT